MYLLTVKQVGNFKIWNENFTVLNGISNNDNMLYSVFISFDSVENAYKKFIPNWIIDEKLHNNLENKYKIKCKEKTLFDKNNVFVFNPVFKDTFISFYEKTIKLLPSGLYVNIEV